MGTAAKTTTAATTTAAPGPGTPPRRPVSDLVQMELHVRSATMLHPDLPEALRGTYAGLAHPAVIAHFKALGVTTLSLLPVHYALDEPALAARGQVNHWAYNTLGFFCPNPRYASGGGLPCQSATVRNWQTTDQSYFHDATQLNCEQDDHARVLGGGFQR